MSEWVFIDIPEGTVEGFAGCEFPFPVRKDRLETFEQLRKETFPLPVLVDELSEYLDEHPERVERYRAAGAYLAFCAAIDTCIDNCREHALDYFRLSLWFDPSNLAVRMSYAVDLHALERREEAIAQYRIIMEAGECVRWWRAWMLCGQALLALGRDAEALAVLREAVSAVPPEDQFWDTLAAAEARLEPRCGVCGAPAPPAARFCPQCGAPLTGPSRFAPAATTG